RLWRRAPAGAAVAGAEPDARRTVPPYAPVVPGSDTLVHVPLNWPAGMPASSKGWSVNFGPFAHALHAAPLQERTRNWYALPEVVPIASRTRVLVAELVGSETAVNAPRLAVLAPVAIWSSNDVPLPFHVRSTGSVLFAIGDRSVIGSLKSAARLCTGALAVGLTAAGV